MSSIAVNLVALGVVLLAFSGLFLSTPGQPVNFAGMHVETTESQVIPLVVGALMVVTGIAWLTVNPKRAA